MATGSAIRCPACGGPAGGDRYCRRCGNDLTMPAQFSWPPDALGERTEYIAELALTESPAPRLDALGERTEYFADLALVDPPVNTAVPVARAGPGVPAGPAGPVAAGPPAWVLQGPSRRRPTWRRRSVLVLVVLTLVGGGAYGGYQLVRGQVDRPGAAGGRAGASAAPGGSQRPLGSVAPGSTASGTGAGPSPAPPASTPPTALVTAAPALLGQPETAEVITLLQSYFTAVNVKDYSSFYATQVDRGQIPSEAQFRSGFASTQDSDVRLLALHTEADGSLVASVAFVSHQDPAQSPDHSSPCLQWYGAYPLTKIDDQLRIDVVNESALVHTRC